MEYSDEQKKKALLLCIFLGWLGIHRFYLHKVGTGVLWACTMGLCFVGWLYDIYAIASGAMFRTTPHASNTKNLEQIYSSLKEGEGILFSTQGVFAENFCTVACTNERILFASKVSELNRIQHEMPIESITSISYKIINGSGAVMIWSYGALNQIDGVPYNDVDKFVGTVNGELLKVKNK